MKIKTRLTFGVGLLFILIILLAGVSTKYVNSLKNDTKNILTANYNTLEYGRNMLLALDEIENNPLSIIQLEKNLEKQKDNETEEGEKKATSTLQTHFNALKLNPSSLTIQVLIRKDIVELMRLNMEAIERKSDIANQTADSAIIWISVTGSLCFMIAFILLVNLPGNIANPIKELTESIKEVAAQNYSRRVHFESHSEFGELANSFNTMAKKLEEYSNSKLDKILKAKIRIETLINNMHDPIIGIDENKKILFANNEALKISGLQNQEIIGKQIEEIALKNDLVRDLIKDISTTEKNTVPLKIFANKKESYFEKEIVEINIIPTGEIKPEFIGYVILLRNITPFKELDFAKTNFIATVSHELKTPISSIQLTTAILNHQNTGTLNLEQQNLINSIKEDSDRLLKITGELLNMSQVETGNIQLNLQHSNPSLIVKYALETTKNQIEPKHIKIHSLIDENLPAINIDAEKTAWVLTNFITNAIRYSPENSEVIVSLKRDADQLVFSVTDVGSGIDDRYKERIFERYFQIPGSNRAGTGLGLAISKDFIETQGGQIGVISNPGLGSTFYFNLPLPS